MKREKWDELRKALKDRAAWWKMPEAGYADVMYDAETGRIWSEAFGPGNPPEKYEGTKAIDVTDKLFDWNDGHWKKYPMTAYGYKRFIEEVLDD